MRSFEKRIFYGIAIIAMAFAPIVAASFVAVHQVFEQERRLISVNAEQLVEAQQLRYLNSTLSSIMPIYVLSGDSAFLADFDRQYSRFDEIAAHLKNSETSRAERALLERIAELSARGRKMAEPGVALRKKGASTEEVHAYFEREAAPVSTELRDLLSELVKEESAELDAAKAHLARAVNWVVGALVLLSAIAIALLIFSAKLILGAVAQKRRLDETQEKLLAQERGLSRARKDAVETVAHDLKNPLGTLKLSVEMMLDDASTGGSPSDLKPGLEIAARSIASMQRLIGDLLDHAKIEAGHLVLKKDRVDLRGLVRELAERFAPTALAGGVALTAETGRLDVAAECDRGRIEQVLSNLMGNALKFAPKGGHVRIELREGVDEIAISVADDGPGLAPEQAARVFDRFWQVEETAEQGHGLGLAIAKGVVEAHGGRIWVESKPGVGATFSFSVPRGSVARGPGAPQPSLVALAPSLVALATSSIGALPMISRSEASAGVVFSGELR